MNDCQIVIMSSASAATAIGIMIGVIAGYFGYDTHTPGVDSCNCYGDITSDKMSQASLEMPTCLSLA